MENTALIDDLNDHCLKHIFSFLSIKERLGIEKVCKRWRRISEEGWNDVKQLEIVSDHSDDIIQLILKRCGRFLRTLKIDEFTIQRPDSLSMVIEFCRLDHLEMIEITMPDYEGENVDFDLSNLREIFEKSGKLETVRIIGDLPASEPDYLDFLNPETFQHLLLSRNRKRISINLDRFPKLKRVFLLRVEIIEDAMIRTEESLKDLEDFFFFGNLSENFIQRILTFQNLRVLLLSDLSDDNIINNEHIGHIAASCGKIREMILEYLPRVTSDCFQYLGKMPSLEEFDFKPQEGINPHDIMYLTNVKTLSLHYARNISTDGGLIELIVNSSNLEKVMLINMGARRSLLADIGRIFMLGQRKKHLTFIVKDDMCSCDEGKIPLSCRNSNANCPKKINYHPLFDLRANPNDLWGDDEAENQQIALALFFPHCNDANDIF